MTKAIINKVNKFITDNDLVFADHMGSDLNGNCTTLAGFICYILEKNNKASIYKGLELIRELKLPSIATMELERVFEFAYVSDYENYWKTEEARDTYKF